MSAFTVIGYTTVVLISLYFLIKFIGLVRDVGLKIALLSPVWIIAMLLRRK